MDYIFIYLFFLTALSLYSVVAAGERIKPAAGSLVCSGCHEEKVNYKTRQTSMCFAFAQYKIVLVYVCVLWRCEACKGKDQKVMGEQIH